MTGCKKAIDYLKGNVFSPNTFYERAIGVLDVHHCITIIGPPGSGKTLTAIQLAYRKYEKSGLSKMYFCQTVEEILDTANKNKGVCIIMDDWIDKYVYYPSELDNAIDLLSSVYNEFVRSGKVHLILTAQGDKWDRISGSFKNCLLFQENSLLQIRLTKKEKLNMILSHFKHFNIKECSRQKQNKSEENCADYLTKLKNEEWFSFPVIIDLICTNERLGRKQQLILKNGFSDVFLAFFDNWLHNDDINERKSFCILVFAAFLGGKVSHRNFKSLLTGPLFEKVCNKFKCDLNAGNGDEVIYNRSRDQEIDLPDQEIDHEILFRGNRRLRSCLYRTISGQNDTMFIFQHSSLFRFVLSYLKDKEEVFFIENVCIEVLIKQCWIEEGLIEKFRADQACSSLKQPVGSVRLSTSVLKLLAERIYHEKEQGYHIPKWDDHIFMRHRTFKEMWNKIDLAKSSCSIDK